VEVSRTGWSEEILSQLDRSAEAFMYPGLPNEWFALALQRLTAFRSADEWLLVFEVVGWGMKQAAFENLVTAFGNRLEQPGGIQRDVVVVTGPDGESPWDEHDDFRLDLRDLRVEARGKAVHLKPSDADLAAAAVDDDAMPAPARVIRLLAHERPELLVLTDTELLEACGRADAGLERFLQLDGWRQPDLLESEQPSDVECLRSLAEALAAGDAGRYACPEPDWNTHWTDVDG
jgi:Family of unknown function (DUF7003)